MTKTYHFMAGLPRSGSTVLSAILNQNPEVYSSPQTDLLGMLYELETKIPTYESYQAKLLFSSFDSAIRGLAHSFYSPIDKPVIIDKNRGWGTPYNFDNISPYLNSKGKVILTLRPILEVLASYVKISLKTEELTGNVPYLNQNLWVSSYRSKSEAQVENLMMPNGEIDRAIFAISNLLKNHGDRVFVVWYDNLLENPQATLDGIYDFLELDRFQHNFSDIVEADTHDDFSAFGIVGLHDIKPRLTKSDTDPKQYLSDYSIAKYKNALDFLWS